MVKTGDLRRDILTVTEAQDLEKILLSKFKKLSSKDISLIMNYNSEIIKGERNEKEIYKKEKFQVNR